MSSLSDQLVIETLDRYGFLRLGDHPRSDSPTDDEWDAYETSWAEIPPQPAGDDEIIELPVDRDSNRERWAGVANEINRIARGTETLPPPGSVDALAWYLPFHNFGFDWGIYIRELEIIRLAAFIAQRLPSSFAVDGRNAQSLARMGMSILYLHEAFHHKVESFATRLEMARLKPVYLPYSNGVYLPAMGTDDLLEEAVACAEMLTRLTEPTYKKGVSTMIRNATEVFLREWIPNLPPGYRRGLDAASQDNPRAQTKLQSQIAEASARPAQNPSDWEIGSHMMRGLFDRRNVMHVLVPIGQNPIIPWFSTGLAPSVSTMAVEKLVVRSGYAEVPGGKGSHRKFTAAQRPLIILPANRKSLSPGVLRNVASSLGFGSIRELAAAC